MSERAVELIRSRSYVMTLSDARNGLVKELKDSGVNDLILCMVGKGRSPDAAELLLQYNVYAIALAGGYNELSYLDISDKIFRELRKFNRISTRISQAELKMINGYYFGLKIYKNFENDSLALGDLSRYYT